MFLIAFFLKTNKKKLNKILSIHFILKLAMILLLLNDMR